MAPDEPAGPGGKGTMAKPTPMRITMLAAAFVGLVAGFLPWLEYPSPAFGHPLNAFDGRLVPLATWAPLACLAALAVLVLLTVSPGTLPSEVLGFSPDQSVPLAGVLSVLIAIGFLSTDLGGYQTGWGPYVEAVAGATLVATWLVERSQTGAAVGEPSEEEPTPNRAPPAERAPEAAPPGDSPAAPRQAPPSPRAAPPAVVPAPNVPAPPSAWAGPPPAEAPAPLPPTPVVPAPPAADRGHEEPSEVPPPSRRPSPVDETTEWPAPRTKPGRTER